MVNVLLNGGKGKGTSSWHFTERNPPYFAGLSESSDAKSNKHQQNFQNVFFPCSFGSTKKKTEKGVLFFLFLICSMFNYPVFVVSLEWLFMTLGFNLLLGGIFWGQKAWLRGGVGSWQPSWQPTLGYLCLGPLNKRIFGQNFGFLIGAFWKMEL